MEKVTFEFSWETLFRLAVLTVSLYAVYQIRAVLGWFLFALTISLLFNPLIDYLQKKGSPRTLAVIFAYFSLFSLFALLIYLFAPLLIVEIHYFSQSLPQYFDRLSPPLRGLGIEGLQSFENFADLTEKTLSQMAQNIFSALFSIFGGIFTTLFIISLAFFLSLEEKAVEKSVFLFFPAESEQFALELWRRCQKKVSGWFLSRVLSSLFVGVATCLSLVVLQSDYPFSFGLLAGVLNFVPIIGPFVTGFIMTSFLALTSPLKAVLALVVFILIQQVESNVILPVLSKKLIGLSPVLVMMSLAVGAVLGGFWGAVLGLPLAGILFEFLHDFLKKRKQV
jgi:predicted PurR-regulated permease PerM